MADEDNTSKGTVSASKWTATVDDGGEPLRISFPHDELKLEASLEANPEISRRVVVVGAGVVGLTTALVLSRTGYRVTVVSSESAEETTSAVAGAIVGGPMFVEPVTRTRRWQAESVREFTRLSTVDGSGVTIQTGRMVSDTETSPPEWAKKLPGFRECNTEEREQFQIGFWATSPIVDMPRYLRYLMTQLRDRGVAFIQQTLSTLEEAATEETEAVVNCSGMGSRRLAPDSSMYSVRGQHVIVTNPGLTNFFLEYAENQGEPAVKWAAFFPHRDKIVCGGVAEIGDENREPRQIQTREILDRCIAVEPLLAGARVLRVDVGLRPMRPTVRLEQDPNRKLRVIHNYGHGWIGVTLSWGCARDVLAILAPENEEYNDAN